MRLKFVSVHAASLCLLISLQGGAAASLNGGCAFPRGLGEEISRKYPGRRLVSLADLDEYDRKLFQKDHGKRCPGLVRINFFGDGKPTWALVLIAGESPNRKAELIVARHIADGWEVRSLAATNGTPVVWREGPGKYDDLYGKKTIRATRPVIVFASYGSSAVVFAWTGKEVESVQISD